MYKVDLNSDLGESFGAYKIGLDSEVVKYVTSVNVACGYHAGDPIVMDKTVAMAKEHGVAVGAHPGFPDLMGFGRRNMVVTPAEAKAYTQYQVGALAAFCKANGVPLQHVKPHGAIAEGVASVDSNLIFMGLAGSLMLTAAKAAGLRTASEVFADRAYQADGTLVPRSKPGAVIHDTDEAIARTIRMVKEGKVTAITGEEVEIAADSICVHGDNVSAVEFVKNIRARLEAEGVTLAPLSEIV